MRETVRFIEKNNAICQEFSYADPITKIKLNSIYNNREAEAIDKTWNVAMRKMFELHHSTDKYLIDPLSETRH